MNTTLIILLSLTALFSASAFIFNIFRSLESKKEETGMVLIQQQMESLRVQLSDSLLKTNELMNQQLGLVSSQMQQQMQSVQQSLAHNTGQINHRLDDASKVVQNVAQQLGSLSQATERIFEATKSISSLEEILKPPKLRGGMGEILLANILSEIMPSKEFYSLQHTFKTGDVVDAAIHLKDGIIPIDAKFPLDNFRRYIESQDEKEKTVLRKEFIKNVKKHIDDISKKYILQDEGTLNFALMYIPAENVYYEIIVKSDDLDSTDLYSYSTQKHVFPVSPNSLYPYLMTLSLGLRGMKIEQQAKQILGELSRLYGDLEKFSKDFKVAGGHITDAQKKFSEAEKKLDRIDIKLISLKEGYPQELQLEE